MNDANADYPKWFGFQMPYYGRICGFYGAAVEGGWESILKFGGWGTFGFEARELSEMVQNGIEMDQ